MKRIVIHGWTGLILLGMILYGVIPANGSEIERGEKLYEEKRCGMCHAIGGQGGRMGPDLSDVENQRNVEWLMKFLKDPKGAVRGAKMMPVKASEEELSALVEYLLSLKK